MTLSDVSFEAKCPILVTGSIEPDEICSICLSQLSSDSSLRVRKITVCGHKFHDTCLSEWLVGTNNTCPLCRSPPKPVTLSRMDQILHDLHRMSPIPSRRPRRTATWTPRTRQQIEESERMTQVVIARMDFERMIREAEANARTDYEEDFID